VTSFMVGSKGAASGVVIRIGIAGNFATPSAAPSLEQQTVVLPHVRQIGLTGNSLWLIAFCMALAGCLGRDGVSSSIVHPTPEGVVLEAVGVTEVTGGSWSNDSTRPIRADLSDDIYTIGQSGEGDGLILGKVEQVTHLGDMGFAILDSRYHRVSVFGWDGSRKGSFGSPGVGPGEFQHPEAMTLVSESAQEKLVQSLHPRH
jgi:hypothetical protein